MPVMFVQVGSDWINLDHVTHVEFCNDREGSLCNVIVHFLSGKPFALRTGEQWREFAEALEHHRVPSLINAARARTAP